MEIAKRLGPIELEEVGGDGRRRLETLWADQPLVLVFLRHFG